MSLSRRLESCSLERITKMKDVVVQEIDGIDRQLVEKEKELDEMIETVETVSLSKRHGQYELSLDKAEAQISRLNDEKEKLQDKVRIIEQARQKKHLMDEQARVLGSVARVRAKDLIIFFLILFLISILAVDFLGIGATGTGAIAKAEVVEGRIHRINVLNGGQEYERVNIHIADAVGSGALVSGQVVEGKLTQADVIHLGENYTNPVVEIEPHFSVGTLWIFWIIDVICCAIFMANFFFEHRLAESKKWYWKHNWIDFITSIPLPPVQVIAASQVGDLGIVRLGRLLRAVRILTGAAIISHRTVFLAGHGSLEHHVGRAAAQAVFAVRIIIARVWGLHFHGLGAHGVWFGVWGESLVELYDAGHGRVRRHPQSRDGFGQNPHRFSGDYGYGFSGCFYGDADEHPRKR